MTSSSGILCILHATILWVVIPCIAQPSHPVFEHLTMDEGLSSNKVVATLQDSEGFYWIATANGLNRFDGTSFKTYSHRADDSTSLTHNFCTALAEGLNGDIWIGTYWGLSRYIKNEGKFKPYYMDHPTRNFELANRIFNVVADGDQNIWIAGSGLWKYDYKTDHVTLFEGKTDDQHSPSPYAQIRHLVYDEKQNGLWFSTSDELNFFDLTALNFYKKSFNPKKWKVFEHADAYELTLDRTGRLWFREHKTQQLGYFNPETNELQITGKKITSGVSKIQADELNRIWILYFMDPTEILVDETGLVESNFFMPHHRRSMSSRLVKDLFIDDQHNYWIGTNEGLHIYNAKNQYYSIYELDRSPLNEPDDQHIILSIAQTDSHAVWLGTWQGLLKYDLNAASTQELNLGKNAIEIQALCAEGDKLWIATGNQLLQMDTKSKSILFQRNLESLISFLVLDDEGDLWIGMWLDGLYKIDLPGLQTTHFKKNEGLTSLQNNTMLCGLADQESIWMGHNGGNFFSKLNINTLAFEHFIFGHSELSMQASGTITSIAKDNSGALWLGTHGGGLFQYNETDHSFHNYQNESGLKSNFINTVLTDEIGNVWISTADGMNYFNSNKSSMSGLDLDLVFKNNDITHNGIRGMNGKLYFFCHNLFVEIDPQLYRSDNTFPKMVISNFKIFDEERSISSFKDQINLSWRENFFSFEYAALKTHPEHQVNYAYILAGFDKDWNFAGERTLAAYTNVPTGSYQFKVKATNNAGQWSDTLYSMNIHISPPFWSTWWFYLLCACLISAGVYAIYSYRLKQLKKIYAIKSKISQDLHDDVGASLSSIHIYSSVAEKALQDNPQRAGQILGQIKQNSRQVMENMSDIIWAINAEQGDNETLVGRIKNYGHDLLSQKQIECTYQIDPLVDKKLQQTEARKNILLMVKEAVNNIAKYSEATHADLGIQIEGQYLVIRIADNGKGFDASHLNGGNGLKNMRLRTDALGGVFTLFTGLGQGTRIESKIPLANISER